MQAAATQITSRNAKEEQRRYRIERQFSSQRCTKELVRDLLRAHCGA